MAELVAVEKSTDTPRTKSTSNIIKTIARAIPDSDGRRLTIGSLLLRGILKFNHREHGVHRDNCRLLSLFRSEIYPCGRRRKPACHYVPRSQERRNGYDVTRRHRACERDQALIVEVSSPYGDGYYNAHDIGLIIN